MKARLIEFHCSECGNVNWIITEEHAESAEDYCVQCRAKTKHEKANSRGR